MVGIPVGNSGDDAMARPAGDSEGVATRPRRRSDTLTGRPGSNALPPPEFLTKVRIQPRPASPRHRPRIGMSLGDPARAHDVVRIVRLPGRVPSFWMPASRRQFGRRYGENACR